MATSVNNIKDSTLTKVREMIGEGKKRPQIKTFLASQDYKGFARNIQLNNFEKGNLKNIVEGIYHELSDGEIRFMIDWNTDPSNKGEVLSPIPEDIRDRMAAVGDVNFSSVKVTTKGDSKNDDDSDEFIEEKLDIKEQKEESSKDDATDINTEEEVFLLSQQKTVPIHDLSIDIPEKVVTVSAKDMNGDKVDVEQVFDLPVQTVDEEKERKEDLHQQIDEEAEKTAAASKMSKVLVPIFSGEVEEDVEEENDFTRRSENAFRALGQIINF